MQPPGITLLMVPAALLAKVTGTAWGLAIGRILTMLAGTASIALTGLLVRHRGRLAVLRRLRDLSPCTRTPSSPPTRCWWSRGWCCSA